MRRYILQTEKITSSFATKKKTKISKYDQQQRYNKNKNCKPMLSSNSIAHLKYFPILTQSTHTLVIQSIIALLAIYQIISHTTAFKIHCSQIFMNFLRRMRWGITEHKNNLFF